jgi:gamma-glutamyltranspeptidase/glutathione hydrolase
MIKFAKNTVVVFVFLVYSSQLLARSVEGHKMMVATPSPIAAQVAKNIIQKGGNVVDVAVGIGLTLAVTSPYFGSLGGGGFALIKMGKDPVQALDFRETAPSATHEKFYSDKPVAASTLGPLAIGVPGLPKGLWEMHKKYGKIHWSLLMLEPIKLAQNGFSVSGEWVEKTDKNKEKFTANAKNFIFKKDGTSYKPGEILKQPQLAKALKEMSNRGVVPFYEGPVARDIVNTVKKLGGVLTMEDFRKYRVRWLEPLQTQFLGNKLYLMPPPSSGGMVITSALKMVEKIKLSNFSLLKFSSLYKF